jgi:DNA-binding MurR/RpiR family transcriptional regulator
VATIVASDGADDVISNLRRRYDELTHSQKRIAELIVDDPEFVAFATVDKVAARLDVSPSTIVRFAYRLELSGYPDLQDQVRANVLKGLRRTETAGVDEGIVATSLEHDVEILSKTATRLDPGSVDTAIRLIARARRVRVVGSVTSQSLASYAAIALDRVRADVVLVGGIPTGSVLDLDADDAVLAFSFPPYARATLDAVAAAKARAASVVAVTDSPISPLRRSADVLLPVVVSGVGTQNSLVAAMAVANAIVNGVTAQLPNALDRYSETVELLSEWDVYHLEPRAHD